MTWNAMPLHAYKEAAYSTIYRYSAIEPGEIAVDGILSSCDTFVEYPVCNAHRSLNTMYKNRIFRLKSRVKKAKNNIALAKDWITQLIQQKQKTRKNKGVDKKVA